MPIAKQLKVQAFIQGLLEGVNKLEQASTIFQDIKVKFVNHNPDLTDTNVNQNQVDAMNTFIADVKALVDGLVVSTLKSKDHPSHGTRSLD